MILDIASRAPVTAGLKGWLSRQRSGAKTLARREYQPSWLRKRRDGYRVWLSGGHNPGHIAREMRANERKGVRSALRETLTPHYLTRRSQLP